MAKIKKELKDVIENILNLQEVRKLPPEQIQLIKAHLESLNKVRFPITTFKENNEWIANTSLIPLCAQGETEEEAVECLKEMIDDYMTDPHTKKPTIETILQVSIREIPIELPLDTLLVSKK
jgi:predicted RNase H-like HicB family nuclease